MPSSSYPPVKGQPFDLYFSIEKDDGTDELNPAGLACRVVVDGRAVSGPTPRVVDALTGACLAKLTAAQTSGACIFFRATSTTTGTRPYRERIHTAAQTLDRMAARELRRKPGGWR